MEIFDMSAIRIVKGNPRWNRRTYSEELYIPCFTGWKPSPERVKLLKKLVLETEFLYLDWMEEVHPSEPYTQMDKKTLKKYEQWRLRGRPLTENTSRGV